MLIFSETVSHSMENTCVSSTNSSFFDEIPPELIVLIVSFLDVVEQHRIRRISKGWLNILISSVVLREITLDVPTVSALRFSQGFEFSKALGKRVLTCIKGLEGVHKLCIAGWSGLNWEDFWMEELMADCIQSSCCDTLEFVNSTLRPYSVSLLIQGTKVRSLTLNNVEIDVNFRIHRSVANKFMAFKLNGRYQTAFLDTTDIERRMLVETWMTQLAEDHLEWNGELAGLDVGTWPRSFWIELNSGIGTLTWDSVVISILMNEPAYKSRVHTILPEGFDFKALQPMTRLEIGHRLIRRKMKTNHSGLTGG